MKETLIILVIVLFGNVAYGQDSSMAPFDFEFQIEFEYGGVQIRHCTWDNHMKITRINYEIVLEFKSGNYSERQSVDKKIANDLTSFLESSSFDKYDTNKDRRIINGDTVFYGCVD